MNVVLWLKADPKMRLWRKRAVKNKSGQPNNEQQGYHPQDLVVSEIFLHCVASGTVTPEQARFGDALPDGEARRRNHPPLKKNFDGVEPQNNYLKILFGPPTPKIRKLIFT